VRDMNSVVSWHWWPVRLIAGLAVGVVIAYIDNYAFGGEVSPIIVVAMLLATTITAGAFWGQRGWVAAVAAWACVPLAHLVKHVLGLPDTVHPNTYASILLLAAFSLGVATAGTGCGVLINRFRSSSAGNKPNPT
jgi:hypothetical protein